MAGETVTVEIGDGVATASMSGRAQSDGNFVIQMKSADNHFNHHMHVEVSATPSAGSLAFEGKAIGAATFEPIDGSINMVSGPRWLMFTGYYSEIRATPTGFDADKTFNLFHTAGR